MNSVIMNYNTINLGHGSGGLMTRTLLNDIIFNTFSNPYLDKKHDGSIVKLDGELAISTDSFVVSPIFFKGGNIGELAVNGTVNDVAMCGATPKFLSLAFIVEEGLKMEDFVKIVNSIKKTADHCKVEIITGDTKVVERGKGDKIFINTTGVGLVHPKANIATSNIKTDDKIIVNNHIAQHGMAIMSEREGLQFESTIKSDTTNLNILTNALIEKFGKDIHLFRDATRGGVGSVLTELAQDTGKGIVIVEKQLPIDRQVMAACEILGLDPLYVANEGVFIAVVDATISEDALSFIKNFSRIGKNAQCIGEVTLNHPNKVVMHSAIGGKRIVSPLIGEQLPRIC